MDRRRLLFIGAGLGGVLLGLLLLKTVFGGDGNQQAVRSSAPTQATTTTTTQATAATERASLPAEVAAEGRDPFLPVVAVPKVQSALGSPQATAASLQSTGPTAPPSAASQTNAAAYASLELKAISQDPTRVVQILVDGQTYNVKEGETFSYGYRLERVVGDCVEVTAEGARAEMCLSTPAP